MDIANVMQIFFTSTKQKIILFINAPHEYLIDINHA